MAWVLSSHSLGMRRIRMERENVLMIATIKAVLRPDAPIPRRRGARWMDQTGLRQATPGIQGGRPPASVKKAASGPNAPSGKKAAAPQLTVTLRQIAAELATRHELAKSKAEAVLGELVALTARHLKAGDKIRLTGLGILQVQNRPARMGRNPATGEPFRSRPAKRSRSGRPRI